MTRRSLRVLIPALAATAGIILMTRVISAQVVERKPNLVAFPAAPLSLSVVRDGSATLLRFATTSWNHGTGPLELRAGEISSDNQRRKVYQRVYLSDGGYYDHYAGEFEYHPEHGHFHFENYALYTLKPVNAPGASQTQSAKTTFCVMDTTKVDLSAGPAVYTTCGAEIQGMSVGWGDTYGASLPGQSFDVTGYPEGDYDIIIEIDPKTALIETTRVDNTSCLRVHLNPSARTVNSLGSCATQAGVTIESITPNYAYQGTVVYGVTIKGSGFVTGMAVGFENGSGQAPVASDVTVPDPNTITLTVSVKSGGGRRERLWDVRVSSAVLKSGFTVRP
jgi:hypothetical protein